MIVRDNSHKSSIIFCSGAGVCEEQFEDVGFNVLLAVDFDKNATDCYKANYPAVKVLTKRMEDLSGSQLLKIAGLKVGELDHMHCSWPCVEYSPANTGVAKRPPKNINRIFLNYLRKIREMQPKTWTGENVDGMLIGAKKPYFQEALLAIKKLGNYEFKYKIVNTAFYGVPQNRRRLIIIARRKDINSHIGIQFPVPNSSIEGLRVKDIFPNVQFYRQNQFGKEVIHNSHLMCTITATDGITIYENGSWRKISIAEIKRFMGVTANFKLPSHSRSVNVRLLGNGIPPPLMKQIMIGVRNILGTDTLV
jgi:site-specific DNA-cytosine methylase